MIKIKRRKRPKLDQSGQTAVEYILMLLVMVTIITSLLSYIKIKYLGDPAKCNLAANKDRILCKINSIFEPQGNDKKFQYFRFK